uniref:polysaccharide pyruvyl transferase family protein n=1 Tax=uncultured Halomonas sp. TaxID=173971 RepID=UPI0026347A3F|nr:polysaccharide pyruvyl transferase family protein [uncultured Halomonas sp.]
MLYLKNKNFSWFKICKSIVRRGRAKLSLPIKFLNEMFCLILKGKKAIPLRYFSAKKNVGDALNVYLVENISRRSVVEIKSSWVPHVLGVGSIMHLGSSKSVVWGSGVIDEPQIPNSRIIKKMKFSAVRGVKTRNLISEVLGKKLSCPLGDPAVLMPFFYTPTTKKKYRLGVVPHYVDKNTSAFTNFLSESGAKIVDVELPVEKFINELAECDVVVSSSLHGLILSDAYDIPNIWVRFSNGVIGGNFKFLDYYSTTDSMTSSPVDLSVGDFIGKDLDSLVSKAKVALFVENKKLLLDAFPSRL